MSPTPTTTTINSPVSTPAGPATVTSTAEHLYWDTTTHTWTPADNLNPGDQLDTPGNGHATITATKHYTALQTTYNLTITYYVVAGTTAVLVHNVPPGSCSITSSSDAPVINSKTLFTSKDGSFRVDIENQSPGQPGAGIHLQFMGRGADLAKYYYDAADGSWVTENGNTLSSKVAKQVPQSVINKAFQYFGLDAP